MFFNLLYVLALTLLSPLILYRRLCYGRYRQGVREKCFGISQSRADALIGDAASVIWLHAVSVGEVQLLPELVRRCRQKHPQANVVISTSTDTGMTVARKHFGDRVFFCPLDFSWAVNRTLDRLRCDHLILMELELWPNLIAAASRRRCRVSVVNARLSESSCRGYHRFAWLLNSTFARLTWVGCQDPPSAERFASCGVPRHRIRVTGSLKFDNAPTSRDSAAVHALINWSGVEPWHRVWCVGSTQAGEEAMALRVYQTLRASHPELRLILVPRHAERFETVARLIHAHGLRAVRRSRNHDQYADILESDEVILVDTIGELRSWWGVADVATVGGSFGSRGGQNMIEPAGYGCAVSFGPNTTNFRVIAEELVNAGGAVRVLNEEELVAFVTRCLIDPPAADHLGRSAQAVVRRHRGAHDRTLEDLFPATKVSQPIRRAA